MTTQVPAPDEGALLAQVAQGDVDALRVLYRAFEAPLYALGVRWSGDRELAEELVQEVTLRIWRKAHLFDASRGKASSWIFGIARHVATDLARSKARHATPTEDLAEKEGDPWDQDLAWQAWEVGKAVRRLPIDQQRVVELAFNQAHTQSEIARVLDIPLGTVKTRMRLALAKLETDLGESGVVEGARP